MTPAEYERHVAVVLRGEGWNAQVTPPQRDFGLDVVCERPGRRLGVQVKMYGGGRPVNSQMVMQLHGAAAFQDCTEAMLVTDGRVLGDAKIVAEKLGIELRYLPMPPSGEGRAGLEEDGQAEPAWTFDRVWVEEVMPLAGRVLTRPNGATNEIIAVDWGGLTRRTSKGSVARIEIEIFRWAIERLLEGELVLRDEIDGQYPKRASSGIALVLGSLTPFEIVRVGSKTGLRRRADR